MSAQPTVYTFNEHGVCTNPDVALGYWRRKARDGTGFGDGFQVRFANAAGLWWGAAWEYRCWCSGYGGPVFLTSCIWQTRDDALKEAFDGLRAALKALGVPRNPDSRSDVETAHIAKSLLEELNALIFPQATLF